MRLGVALTAVVLALVWSCAHVEAPPGGAEDKSPPVVIVTRPDTLAIVPGWDAPAVLVFDERISERGVQEAVVVSPRTSNVVVDHRGDEVRVRLRGGWEPGRIYQVTVLPETQDLFNNRLAEPATLVFSTGPEIPSTLLTGVVRDPITGRPEAGVRVEAVYRPDSLVYAIPTDSAGRYRFRRVPEGEYQLRAFRDLNRNRALDPFEARGIASAVLVAGDSLAQALGVLPPDSTAPRLASAEQRDSVTVELKFDDYLDPAQGFPAGSIQILSPEGLGVAIASVQVGTESAAGAGARTGAGADTAAADTAGPLPSQTLRVQLGPGTTLQPGTTYTVRVLDVRNVVGLAGNSETELETPEPPAGGAGAPVGGAPASDTARVRISQRRIHGSPEP